MAVDTPARIAILGAGPIGLEAALYARFLGYDVDIYERGRVAENLFRWGHVQMVTPFGDNRSTLGLAALAAQDEQWIAPRDDAFLTGREIAEKYYLPLAQSDLLVDNLKTGTAVVAIGREGLLKHEHIGEDDVRIDAPFRILLEQHPPTGTKELLATADVVIDTTGSYSNPNWLGNAGIPAPGERDAHEFIEYGLPDVLDAERNKYAHRHTLVVGSGLSAATTVIALESLARESPSTKVTWLTRRPNPSAHGPVELKLPELAEMKQIAAAANRMAGDDCDHVTHWPSTVVDSVEFLGGNNGFRVQLNGQHARQINCDRIVANVGYRPDHTIYRELQVRLHHAADTTTRLGKSLVANGGEPEVEMLSAPRTLMNPEPDFYLLGSKSYGRCSRFLIADGLRQIRDLFTIIGDRKDLDLYVSMAKMLPRNEQ